MKLSKKLKLAAIFIGAIALTTPLLPAVAQFTEAPIPTNEVAAIAVPAGAIGYNLNVVQQVAGKKQCFAEKGTKPIIIDPLWTTFDYTGNCNLSTDSNGYSVRLDGKDTSLDYRLDIISKGEDLQLVAKNYQGGSDLVVGQTFGKPAKGEYVKINLNPGWEFSKKSYQGKVLGHFFFSGNSQAIAAASGAAPTAPTATNSSFSDTSSDIYKDEIEKAVALGFIAGYKDKTFRPTESLTREQLVSMVYGALGKVDGLTLASAESVSTQPYPDVTSDRWSAAKIQWAKQSAIVKGYPDGSFQPEKPVSRAELVTVLKNMALFANNGSTELKTSQKPAEFSDTTGHWGNETIQTMSAYCGVASPYQEVGNAFQPDSPAARDYAAAATLRTHGCLTKK
jgi:N-acetylmuramoyl-L-alanine amidase